MERGDSAATLQLALQERLKELNKLEELRPDLERVEELKKEIQLLRNLTQKSLQQGLTVKVIETDAKTGDIYYYDPTRAEQPQDLHLARGKLGERALCERGSCECDASRHRGRQVRLALADQTDGLDEVQRVSCF